MFGWENMPRLIEMEIMSKEVEFSREFGRPMTPAEKGEAYASATKNVFDALMAARALGPMPLGERLAPQDVDVQWIHRETGEVLGYWVEGHIPSRAGYVCLRNGEWIELVPAIRPSETATPNAREYLDDIERADVEGGCWPWVARENALLRKVLAERDARRQSAGEPDPLGPHLTALRGLP